MTFDTSLVHLIRRATTSISNSPPRKEDIVVVGEVLLAGELNLWNRMQGRDKRHAVVVLRRFDDLCPRATRAERAAALLHDIGKIESDLGWTGRVIATMFGARTPRMRRYLDHESIGSQMLVGVSDPRTVSLVSGLSGDEVSRALRLADDV